jgi:uncharacterized membrane protein YeaQ/YmgE (transglycosylase-associated protein family)
MHLQNIDWQHFDFFGLGWANFIILMIIAGLCGGIAKAITGVSHGGCFVSVVLGFVGALLALLATHYIDLPEFAVLEVGSTRFPVIWSIIGAAVFVTVLSWFTFTRARK